MIEAAIEQNIRPPALSSERGTVRLRTLVLIRWIAVGGQLLTLLVVHMMLGFTLPIDIALGVIAASVLVNIANSFKGSGSVLLGDRDAMLYLGYDVVQMTALLYLSGGLQNPFALLVLAPVTVGASILSRLSAAMLAAITVGAITVLAMWHLPLPWDEDIPVFFPPLYVVGVWLALVLAAIFIAAYVWNVTDEGRRMSDAFAAAQLALAREQRISAVGALAAAAAHELGSPLGTIAVVAKELARDLPPGSPYAEDAQLLLQETARCRTILAQLARQRDTDGGDPFVMLPISALVEAAGEPHVRGTTEIVYETDGENADQPSVQRLPEILHGLGNLIQNALQFARHRVEVMTSWDAQRVTVEVADDGPGFATQVLSRLGQPYLSGRGESQAGHMGLGVFIAETLLKRTGAVLEFSNASNSGAVVRVSWPRRALGTPRRNGPATVKLEENTL